MLPETRARWGAVFQFSVVRIALAFTGLIGAVSLVQLALRRLPARESAAATLFSISVLLLVAFLTYWGYVRVVERRPVTELSAEGAVGELSRGIVLGACLFSVTIGIGVGVSAAVT